MKQIETLSESLHQARNDKPNADYHIAVALEQIPELRDYVRSLESTVDTLSTQLVNSRIEAEELRRKLP